MCIRDRGAPHDQDHDDDDSAQPTPVVTAEEGLEALKVGITFFNVEIIKFSFHKPLMFIFLFLSVL